VSPKDDEPAAARRPSPQDGKRTWSPPHLVPINPDSEPYRAVARRMHKGFRDD
jgi:hypothetical protein